MNIYNQIPESYQDKIFPSEISENGMEYIHSYPFIDRFRLTAIVDRFTGKQLLKISFLDDNSRESDSWMISCIHTAICDLTIEELDNSLKDSDFPIKMIKARSSENVKLIRLSPEEHFLAFKMWVQGIAESGLDAFRIQSDIEEFAHFLTPLSQPLMSFIATHDIRIFHEYLYKIERECVFEGEKHQSSIISNLMPLIDMIQKEPYNKGELIRSIIDIEPPIELFAKEDYSEFLTSPYMIHHPDFPKLFKIGTPNVLISLAKNLKACDFDEYRTLFRSKNIFIRWNVARNPNAMRFEEFSCLFKDSFEEIRKDLAANPKATQFKEFRQLFFDSSSSVRINLAQNQEATKFPEFSTLFFSSNVRVLVNLANNKSAIKFNTFRILFHTHHAVVLLALARNPSATMFDEFRLLFKRTESGIKIAIMGNHKASRFTEYIDLMKQSSSKVRIQFASVKEPQKFDMYEILFDDPDPEVRMAVAKNPAAMKYDKFKKLLSDDDIRIKIELAKNPEIFKIIDYEILINDPNPEVQKAISHNHGLIIYKGLQKSG